MRKSQGVGPNILVSGNRKRSAPSAQAESEQQSSTTQVSTGTVSTLGNNNNGLNSTFAGKESAWNLKDCIFIHEEAVNDTSIVKIVCICSFEPVLFLKLLVQETLVFLIRHNYDLL